MLYNFCHCVSVCVLVFLISFYAAAEAAATAALANVDRSRSMLGSESYHSKVRRRVCV